jgi:hypothetical protein
LADAMRERERAAVHTFMQSLGRDAYLNRNGAFCLIATGESTGAALGEFTSRLACKSSSLKSPSYNGVARSARYSCIAAISGRCA